MRFVGDPRDGATIERLCALAGVATRSFYEEFSSREALLRSGGADVIAAPPASSLPALGSDKALKVVTADTSYEIQLVLNTMSASQPALKDKRVRQELRRRPRGAHQERPVRRRQNSEGCCALRRDWRVRH